MTEVGFPSVDTLGTLIDDVILSLQGHGLIVDQACSLVGNITDSDVSMSIDLGDVLSQGIVEVDDELIYVSRCTNGVATIPRWGRGYKGTIRSAHTDGAKVTISPTYPRSVIRRSVNACITTMYPSLFAVLTEDLVGSYNGQYALPADADKVLAVEYRFSPVAPWMPVRNWQLTHSAPSEFTSGRMLSIGSEVPMQADVHVTMACPLKPLASDDQPFTDTGLQASARDVVVAGAAMRLLPWLDAARTPVQSVPSDVADQAKPLGGPLTVARELRTLYQAGLQRERAALLERYRIPTHGTR